MHLGMLVAGLSALWQQSPEVIKGMPTGVLGYRWMNDSTRPKPRFAELSVDSQGTRIFLSEMAANHYGAVLDSWESNTTMELAYHKAMEKR